MNEKKNLSTEALIQFTLDPDNVDWNLLKHIKPCDINWILFNQHISSHNINWGLLKQKIPPQYINTLPLQIDEKESEESILELWTHSQKLGESQSLDILFKND